jgi:hypothetical protein
MRKKLMTTEKNEIQSPDLNWLDLSMIARAELSSEDPLHPLESALTPTEGFGWRARKGGPQTIRLFFDEPQQISHVHLEFQEDVIQRTQEFALHWSSVDDGRSDQEIVRQQFNFSPPHSCREVEDYRVALVGVTMMQLVIIPDISGGDARASLARLLLA